MTKSSDKTLRRGTAGSSGFSGAAGAAVTGSGKLINFNFIENIDHAGK